jgi:hypothetical protein
MLLTSFGESIFNAERKSTGVLSQLQTLDAAKIDNNT